MRWILVHFLMIFMQDAQVDVRADGEDRRSCQAHVSFIQKELEKLRPDLDRVKDAMERSLAFRKDDGTTERTTNDFIKENPFVWFPGLVITCIYISNVIKYLNGVLK